MAVILMRPIAACSEISDSEVRGPASSDIFPGKTCPDNSFKDAGPFSWVIRIYQRYISPIDGARCPMYPSCSQYAHEAVKKRGGMGIIMAFDRFLRCGRDIDDYPLVFKGLRPLYYDPVDLNNK